KRLIVAIIFILFVFSTSGCTPAPPREQVNNSMNIAQIPLSNQPGPEQKVPGPSPVHPGTDTSVPYDHPFPAQGVPILMYHSIADLPGNNLGVPPGKFAEQMNFLHKAGFTTITPDQLLNAYIGTGKLPSSPILLTFDDGYPDNYYVAFPILKQYGFTATFFVITGDVDHGMLTWSQLKEMQDYGMSIQSHTVSHPDLRNLSDLCLRKQLADSKASIEAKLNTVVKFFCYPSGKYNAQTLNQLKELGYTMGVTTSYGFAQLNQNPLLFSRVRISGDSSLETFKKQVSHHTTPANKTGQKKP
ncbi:MAG TPA: polysaccharide deacetylase family protein, partial [Candidatus Deferrimicrobium sp.]|nr:polysaccharide deacetylase family protein [Candidatus Deferrimicrobium sp.]